MLQDIKHQMDFLLCFKSPLNSALRAMPKGTLAYTLEQPGIEPPTLRRLEVKPRKK